MTMILSTDAFTNNTEIPQDYTCEGEDVSPYLAWEGVPAETKSLVVAK